MIVQTLWARGAVQARIAAILEAFVPRDCRARAFNTALKILNQFNLATMSVGQPLEMLETHSRIFQLSGGGETLLAAAAKLDRSRQRLS